ncbi:hypothetical protein OIU84_009117 [Salix udensis]|uniref:Reticulon-like protein n=1 Tax=Salix udensis TaxID=889485 RepID=A0AAD6JS39_9ROSI|nr:hypothetical protein OIU84_009117 [Salix udensis]
MGDSVTAPRISVHQALVADVLLWKRWPLPPLPKLEIPEEIVAKAAGVIHVYANHALSIAREIVIDKNLKVFLQLVSCLWAASYIGSLCNFLTLVYIGVLLILSAPLMYDKHQHRIDEKRYVWPIK